MVTKGTKRKRKPKTVEWYKKKLWGYFSLYTKERDNWTCFTCGKVGHGWSMNSGHFIPAAVCPPTLYFHEDNVKAQCSHCNLTLEGNHYIYGVKLGKRTVDKLYKLKKDLAGEVWSIEHYKDLIEYYKQLINENELWAKKPQQID